MTPDSTKDGVPPVQRGRGLLRRVAAIPTPVIFLVSIGVAIAVLWRSGDVGEVFESLREANPWALALGAALYLGGLFLLCVRWHLLLHLVHGSSDFGRAGEAFLTSVVINYAAPGHLAIPTRAALTKRALGLNMTETSAVTLWEVGADVLILGLGTVIWLAAGGWSESDVSLLDAPPLLLIATAACIVLGLGGAVVLMRSARAATIRNRVQSVLIYPVRKPRQAMVTLGVTAVYWAIQGIVLLIMLNALDVETNPLFILGVTSLPILVGMFGPLPGGAGIRETLMGGIARIHGVAVSPTIFAAVAYRLALFASIPVLYLGFRLWLSVRRAPDVEGEKT